VPEHRDQRAILAGRPQVDVRLLGPVEVVIDGEPVDVGGPKERTVLALLALAGGPLTHERLVDDLWDGAPPASARKTLQTYVWRLRRALTDEVLASVAAGYELRLDTDPDAARFEHLAGQATDALEGGDPGRARQLLRAALDLWRGDSLAGCAPAPAVDAHRARLEELRAGAEERRIDAELRLGRHAEVVADLERLVQEAPFREERWRLLVLTLYRCGRQADALRAYQRARRELVESLGVEPGPALKGLEQAILEQRPELDVARTSASVSWHVTSPPAPPTPLVGRHAEAEAIRSLMLDHRLVTLTGVGGAGKTRLALAMTEHSQDGSVAFCDLSLLSRDGSVLHAVAHAVGASMERQLLAAQGEPDLPGALVDNLRHRELLVIVDNCEHVLDPCSEIVGRVLADCRGVRVLATSREPLGVPGEQVVPLPPLDLPSDDADIGASSVELFEQRAAAAQPGFTLTPANQGAVVDVCRRLEGLPLALELAAARLSHLTPEELATRLDHPLQVLTTRQHTGPARHRTLQAMLDWSHDLLEPTEQILFRRLAVFAARFGLDDVEACCMRGLDGIEALDLLRGLVDRSLVVADSSDTPTRYRMLDTIRRYAREQLAATADEDDVRAAACRWYLGRIERIPWGKRLLTVDAMQLMADIHEDLRRALVWAESAGRHDLVARLAAAMIGLWKEGHFEEADRWLPVAIEHESSYPPSERTATVLASLMYLFRWDGDLESLRLHRRRLAALVENFPPGQPVTSLAYSTLASICSRLADEEPAWEAYADLAICHAPLDSPPLEAMAWCQKARALMFRGEHEQAIAVLEDAAAKSDGAAEGYQFYPQEDLALAHHLAGNHERALAIAEARVCQIGPALGWYVAVYAALAAAALGDWARARRHLRAAVERETELSMPLTVNDCRMAIGAMALIGGRPSLAVDMLAGLAIGSTSFNTLGVLLRHYQDLAKRAVSPEEWERGAALGAEVDPWPLIEAELSDHQSSVTSSPTLSDQGAATLP